uniref:Uncharacterized protein n=1 Tax=Triticum urartu TaxID=4572 RepID=A0A8R7TBD1_TRIUA
MEPVPAAGGTLCGRVLGGAVHDTQTWHQGLPCPHRAGRFLSPLLGLPLCQSWRELEQICDFLWPLFSEKCRLPGDLKLWIGNVLHQCPSQLLTILFARSGKCFFVVIY